MEIKNEKLKKILSNVGAALKKTAFVFNSEFAIPAVFSVLLFLMIVPVIIFSNFNHAAFEEYLPLNKQFFNLSLSCFAGILSATIGVFVTKKKWLHAICGAAGFGIARLLILMNAHTTDNRFEYFGFIILLALIFMFVIYRGEKKDESLLYIFAKCANASIISNFIFVGLIFCEMLFFGFVIDSNYISEDSFVAITYAFCTCVIGLCYFFSNIHTDSQNNPPLSKMEKGWYHHCLAIIFSVYIFVLYAYFIKIIFVRTLPEGIIGYFVSVATAAYMFMYFSQKQFNDVWTKWFYKIGAYVMLPLIVMQCFAIYQRISAYGLTGTRICNIAYVLLILVFIVLTFYKQGLHIRKFFPIAAAVVFVLMVQPFGAEKIAIMQQTAHFERLLVKNGMLNKETKILTPRNFTKENPPDATTVEELKSICGIYNYLEKRKSLPEYCKDKDFSELFGLSKYYNGEYYLPDIDPYKEYVWKKPVYENGGTIDVSGFNRVFYKFLHQYIENQEKLYIDVFNKKNVLVSFDVTGFIIQNLSAIENNEDSLQLKIDDNMTIEFVEVRFEYDEIQNKFRNQNFGYYILMK